MRLSDFDYFLPKELIAQHPLNERDSSKLMVLNRQSGKIEHRVFKDILDYCQVGDLFVVNDTRVLPARLFGRRSTRGKVELLLLKQNSPGRFFAMMKPGRLKPGEDISFEQSPVRARVLSKEEVSFNTSDASAIYGLGKMPLPPYIKRPAEESDNETYQTVYARNEGAVAAPTAGLHFTNELISKIKQAGADFAQVTLHVGPGTFKPVKTDDICKHKMESEYFIIPQHAAELLRNTRKRKGRVFAVGTTSLRALETKAEFITDHRLPITDYQGFTDLFIYPGYKFKLADCLLTNFHLPKTTLFMLVCAFCAAGASASGGAGKALAKRAYQEAIERKYRFYSYGDAMLIL